MLWITYPALSENLRLYNYAAGVLKRSAKSRHRIPTYMFIYYCGGDVLDVGW